VSCPPPLEQSCPSSPHGIGHLASPFPLLDDRPPPQRLLVSRPAPLLFTKQSSPFSDNCLFDVVSFSLPSLFLPSGHGESSACSSDVTSSGRPFLPFILQVSWGQLMVGLSPGSFRFLVSDPCQYSQSTPLPARRGCDTSKHNFRTGSHLSYAGCGR